ncbi:MAG: PDDEXK nuclease domain-containing protein [bacterium]|nr:PDDEXK nuclease domain-containing protein [bacterium]
MNEVISNVYMNDLKQIKDTIRQNKNKAIIVVNSAMIMTYYEIGTIINNRKTWGSNYIQKLSEDLKEYGKGHSVQNLYRMSQIANEFTREELFSQPAREIPWFTIIEIMHKSNSHEEMLWYINQTHKYGWSRSQVLQKFKEQAYERNLIEPSTSISIKSDDSTNEIFKDVYVFDFLNRNNTRTEKDLTNTLVDNIIKFIQELGSDFAFVGKEYKIITPTNETFYIDILMYHLILHCYVIIEVKNRKFKPQDLGQLLFYVSAIDDLKKTIGDNETVGLLLCKDADSYTSKSTLDRINAKVGVSKYKVLEDLPKYLEKRLKEN